MAAVAMAVSESPVELGRRYSKTDLRILSDAEGRADAQLKEARVSAREELLQQRAEHLVECRGEPPELVT